MNLKVEREQEQSALTPANLGVDGGMRGRAWEKGLIDEDVRERWSF